MKVIRTLEELENNIPSVLTMGTFDGLHRGHRKIISRVTDIAKEYSLRSVVLTFDPHPREIVRKENSDRLYLLTTIDERLEIIDKLGIDLCVVLPFTRELSLLSAEEFFDTILAGSIGASHIIVGEDHAFGKGREGNASELVRLAGQRGIEAAIVEKLDMSGQKISSSTIRREIQRGDVQTAALQLGREYTMQGIVVKGDNLGHKLGFPTANLKLESSKKLIPATGVYAVQVEHDGSVYDGMMNIGKKPTVSLTAKLWLEVHIFKFAKSIYGESLTVNFIDRIRDERKFRTRNELVTQLEKDKVTAGDILQRYEKIC